MSRTVKYLFTALVVSLLIAGCSDNPTGSEKTPLTGNVEITVSYFYNNFVGYRPDVGADAFLFHADNREVYADSLVFSSLGIATIYSENTDGKTYVRNSSYDEKYKVYNDYSSEADVNGLIRFSDIPVGRYFIIISSHGRWTYSYRYIDVEKNKTLLLVKNFGMYHEFEDGGEGW